MFWQNTWNTTTFIINTYKLIRQLICYENDCHLDCRLAIYILVTDVVSVTLTIKLDYKCGKCYIIYEFPRDNPYFRLTWQMLCGVLRQFVKNL
jgi:hypothetical protein